MYVCTCMFVCVHVSVGACECVCLCSRVCVCELLGEKLTLVFVRALMVMEAKPLMKVLVVNKEKASSLQFGKFFVHQCSFMPQLTKVVLTKFLNSVILQSSPLSFPHRFALQVVCVVTQCEQFVQIQVCIQTCITLYAMQFQKFTHSSRVELYERNVQLHLNIQNLMILCKCMHSMEEFCTTQTKQQLFPCNGVLGNPAMVIPPPSYGAN